MPRIKKETVKPKASTADTTTTPDNEVVVDILQSQSGDTPAKAEYRALLRRYKDKNPEKYEQKKTEFEKRLRGNVGIQYSKNGERKTFIFSNTPKE